MSMPPALPPSVSLTGSKLGMLGADCSFPGCCSDLELIGFLDGDLQFDVLSEGWWNQSSDPLLLFVLIGPRCLTRVL